MPDRDHGEGEGEPEQEHTKTSPQLLQELVSCPLTRGLLLESTAPAPAGKTLAPSDLVRDFSLVPHLPLATPAGCSFLPPLPPSCEHVASQLQNPPRGTSLY